MEWENKEQIIRLNYDNKMVHLILFYENERNFIWVVNFQRIMHNFTMLPNELGS